MFSELERKLTQTQNIDIFATPGETKAHKKMYFTIKKVDFFMISFSLDPFENQSVHTWSVSGNVWNYLWKTRWARWSRFVRLDDHRSIFQLHDVFFTFSVASDWAEALFLFYCELNLTGAHRGNKTEHLVKSTIWTVCFQKTDSNKFESTDGLTSFKGFMIFLRHRRDGLKRAQSSLIRRSGSPRVLSRKIKRPARYHPFQLEARDFISAHPPGLRASKAFRHEGSAPGGL